MIPGRSHRSNKNWQFPTKNTALQSCVHILWDILHSHVVEYIYIYMLYCMWCDIFISRYGHKIDRQGEYMSDICDIYIYTLCNICSDADHCEQRSLITLWSEQNSWCFVGVFKCIFLNEIILSISLKFVRKGPADNMSTLVQIMAWCWTDVKSFPDPTLAQINTIICHH